MKSNLIYCNPDNHIALNDYNYYNYIDYYDILSQTYLQLNAKLLQSIVSQIL